MPAPNLPSPLSSFVGREKEVREVVELAQGPARLVTLTGPGGSGKTRLAIEAARQLAPAFSGGAQWVDLAVLRDPGLVLETVGEVLDANGDVAEHIGPDRILLVVDNFEQVVDAGPELAGLLEACPNLHALVTSRERLQVGGEVQYHVPPLADGEAVELFCARAQAAPDDTIADLCRRLDNLPLAIELAAARTGTLSPRQILARLSERLDLFKGGRGAEPRHRTLRAALEWSCQQLDEAELSLFARLAVFEGGCTLDAAEQVACAELDVLQSLVDKNLLVHRRERFSMLETIREYALEQLRTSGEEDQVGARHVSWCLAFLDRSERELASPRQKEVSRWLEADFANVRAAFTRSTAAGDADAALRIVGHRRFWQAAQGHLAEGIEWAEAALSAPGDAETLSRANALTLAGDFRRVSGDLGLARAHLERAAAIGRQLGDRATLGDTLFVLGRVELAAGNAQRAGIATGESVTIARAGDDRQPLGERLAQLGEIAYDQGEADRARVLVQEALGVARACGDAHSAGDSLRVLAMLERDAGRLPASRALLNEALDLQRELADWNCVSVSLSLLGDLALRSDEAVEANALFGECLELQGSRGQWYRALDAFWGLAVIAASQGQLQRAVQLLGAEHNLRGQIGTRFRLGPPDRHDAVLESLHDQMDAVTFARAWEAGLAMSRREALSCALAEVQPPIEPAPEPSGRTPCVLRPEGEYWTVTFGTATFRLRDTKGLRYLARLLEQPGRELHVLDLAAGEHGIPGDEPRRSAAGDAGLRTVRTSDAGSLLDEQAKRSYRERLATLELDLDEAMAWSDSLRAAKIREEMDFLVDELASAVGLGGRDRKAASDAERARVNITRAIRSAITRIREHSTALAGHLDATVHTGTFCSYTPDPWAHICWETRPPGPAVQSR